MKKKTILFGAGNFGKVHANDLNELSVLNGIVDINPEKKEIAGKYQVPFWNIDVSKYVMITPYKRTLIATDQDKAKRILETAKEELKSGLGFDQPNIDRYQTHFNSAREFYKKFKNVELEPCPEEILKANAWGIATNTPSHYLIALLGIDKGIKRIFIEKPPTEGLGELGYLMLLSDEGKNIIGVDYIEMAHPVVLATKEVIGDQEPEFYLHRRSKDLRGETTRGIGGGEGSRITLEDLVHDISELLHFRESLEDAEVVDADITRWNEIDGRKYPYKTDVRARFKINFPEAKAEILGGFADPEVRQYVVLLSKQEGIYGNTLTRPHIDPTVALIEGKNNIENIMKMVREGKILTNEDQRKVLERAGAETLEELMAKYVPECKYKDGKPVYGWAPLYNMLDNWLGADSNEDLICDLGKAYDIQKIVEIVYRAAGKEDAMEVE